MNPEPGLMDVLDHQPDILADAKIKAVMSDIYDELIEYVKKNDSNQVADLLASYGTKKFVEIYISDIYLPSIDDIKVMSYVMDNLDEICEILAQALSNLTPKEALDNLNDDKSPDEHDEKTDTEKELEEELKNGSDEDGGENPDSAIVNNGNTSETQGNTSEIEPGPEMEPEPKTETETEPKPEPEPEGETSSSANEYRKQKDKANSFIKNLLGGV